MCSGEVTALLGDGTTVRCRHIVLATNPARRRIPAWVCDALPLPPRALAHAGDVDLRGLALDGEHVVVVGGGLTAGHLVVGAVARGARVTLVARRPLRTSMFDTDPGWLGPKQLDGFDALEDPLERLRRCPTARDGGACPPWMVRKVRSLVATGAVDLRAPARVCGAHARGEGVALVLGDETTLVADRVWLATGTEVASAATDSPACWRSPTRCRCATASRSSTGNCAGPARRSTWSDDRRCSAWVRPAATSGAHGWQRGW